MKILVTGGGGYIGTTLVPMLLEEGYEVKVLDRFYFGEELLAEHPKLTKIKADSRNYDPSIMTGMDAVIDLVAISNDPSGELLPQETEEINFISRVRTAQIAKEKGVGRYILPSSCSIYGFQDNEVNENSEVNPLTLYAKANYNAENGVLALADNNFTVTVIRQATVFGYSPRMRFDLAINGMTYGAWKTGELPLMRDGSQWRPMVHVQDTSRAMIFLLNAKKEIINKEIFNIGSQKFSNYQIAELGNIVAETIPNKNIDISWYGDPDVRSYRVNFEKLENLGFECKFRARDGVKEICKALDEGHTDKTDKTITLKWYQNLLEWQKLLDGITNNGKVF